MKKSKNAKSNPNLEQNFSLLFREARDNEEEKKRKELNRTVRTIPARNISHSTRLSARIT